MSRHVALLIGISEYGACESAQGRALGSLRLRGAVNDALGYARELRRLGVSPDDLRVLVTPAPAAEELGFDALPIAEATAENIQAGFAWLAERLAAPDRLGVVSYSGHGDLTPQGDFALLPADARSGAATVSLRSLAERVRGASAPVVLLLDTCRTGGQAGDAAPAWEVFSIDRTVMLVAASPGQRAYERCLGGRWQGLWSWAVQRVLEQWKVTPDGEAFTLSNETLFRRASQLVAALGRTGSQTPMLLARDDHRDLPFLGLRRLDGQVEAASAAEPTREGRGSELPGDAVGVVMEGSTIRGWFEVNHAATTVQWYQRDGMYVFGAGAYLKQSLTLKTFNNRSSAESALNTTLMTGSTAWVATSTASFGAVNGASIPGGTYVDGSLRFALGMDAYANPSSTAWHARVDHLVAGRLPTGQVYDLTYHNAPTSIVASEYRVCVDPTL